MKSELKTVTNMMSNEKLSLMNEVARVRDEVTRELESERRKHGDEIKKWNTKYDSQKRNIDKV